MSPAETYKALCERCHGEKGDGNGKVAWYLDPSPRDLTKAGFMNSKPRDRFVASIHEGVAGTSMPAWKKALKPEQVSGVLDYVLTTFTKSRPTSSSRATCRSTNPVATSAASVAHGEQIFLERCTGCHGRKADGKGPNSLDILPRPRNLRNCGFVAASTTAASSTPSSTACREPPCRRWIDYGLSQNDVGDIVNFIRSINPNQQGAEYASNKTPGSTRATAKVTADRGARAHRYHGEMVPSQLHRLTSSSSGSSRSSSPPSSAGRNCSARWPPSPTAGCVPLHVNGMLFGWLLAADMGLTFYIVPRLCGVQLWSEKLGVATAALWNVIILGAVVRAAGRIQSGPRVRRTARCRSTSWW